MSPCLNSPSFVALYQLKFAFDQLFLARLCTSVTLGVTDLFWKYRKCHLAFHAWPVVKYWLVKHCCGNIRTRLTTNTLLSADSHNKGQWILQSNLKWTCANLWSLEYSRGWPVVTHHCSDMDHNEFGLFGSYHNMKMTVSYTHLTLPTICSV